MDYVKATVCTVGDMGRVLKNLLAGTDASGTLVRFGLLPRQRYDTVSTEPLPGHVEFGGPIAEGVQWRRRHCRL